MMQWDIERFTSNGTILTILPRRSGERRVGRNVVAATTGEPAPYSRWQRHFETVWARNAHRQGPEGSSGPDDRMERPALRRVG